MEKSGENCGSCAYSEKKGGVPVWCRFHGEKVTDNNVCDDYLHFMDAPNISSRLATAKNPRGGKNAALPIGVRIKDFFCWLIAVLFIVLGALAFLYC